MPRHDDDPYDRTDARAGHASGAGAASSPRYLTLVEARAIACNGCGDCCDSRRTDGFWSWGNLPPDQYASLAGGQPLIIPIERVEVGWRDRPLAEVLSAPVAATRFRCAAFQPRDDGDGGCGLHDRERPTPCEQFPVWVPEVEADLDAHGEASLQTGSLPRCAWHGVVVVRDDDPRLAT